MCRTFTSGIPRLDLRMYLMVRPVGAAACSCCCSRRYGKGDRGVAGTGTFDRYRHVRAVEGGAMPYYGESVLFLLYNRRGHTDVQSIRRARAARGRTTPCVNEALCIVRSLRMLSRQARGAIVRGVRDAGQRVHRLGKLPVRRPGEDAVHEGVRFCFLFRFWLPANCAIDRSFGWCCGMNQAIGAVF